MKISNRIFEDVIKNYGPCTFIGFKVVWGLGERTYGQNFLEKLHKAERKTGADPVCGYLLHIERNIFYLWNSTDYIEHKMLKLLMTHITSIEVIEEVIDLYTMRTETSHHMIPKFTMSDSDIIMLRLMG